MATVEEYKTQHRRCLKLLLAPFVRFCLRHNHAVQQVINLLKVVYVEEAEKQLAARSEKVNTSRLSAVTGLSRRDVQKIHGAEEPEEPSQSIAARVMGQWENHPDFLTKQGAPRVLTFKGKDNEFKALVQSVSTHLNPGTVLFDLLRLKLVEKSPRGLVFKQDRIRISDDLIRGVGLLSRNISSLIKASQQNMYDSLVLRNLHLRTEYDNIYKSAIPEVRLWIYEEGKAFHKRLREYLSQFDQDITPRRSEDGSEEEAGCRVVIGTFSETAPTIDAGLQREAEPAA